MSNPKVFLSYSWDSDEHKEWVAALATRLRSHGVDVTLDVWNVHPGDYLPEFMEREISESDFVIIVCTPKYKEKSDRRAGGVGFEEAIITGEVLATEAERKFIPILREGEWTTASPRWLRGKLYIDLRGSSLNDYEYQSLLLTLHQRREPPPPLGTFPDGEVKRPVLTAPTLTVIGALAVLLEQVKRSIEAHEWEALATFADSRHYESQVRRGGQDTAQYISELLELYDSEGQGWENQLDRIENVAYLYLDWEPYWITVGCQFRLRDGTSLNGAIHIISEAGDLLLSGAVG